MLILPLALFVAVGGAAPSAFALTLPPGFQQTEYAVQFNPTSFDWDPSGDMWITGRDGRIYRRPAASGPSVEVGRVTNLDISGERGLLGIVVDPDFAVDPWIYVYYTDAGPPPRNRVVRYTWNGTSLVTPVLILEGPDLVTIGHNAGDLRFGPDGYLYVTMGNNLVTGVEQDPGSLLGKLLRIGRDGSIPTTNPFASDPNARGEVWAYGFRNPWRISFDDTGALFIGDVGDATWEELNVGIAGANYGYPQTEGPDPPGVPGVTYPVFTYNHNGSGAAIIAGERMKAGNFPAQYVGDFFYTDFTLRTIFRLELDEAFVPGANEVFVSGIDPLPVHIRVGPDGALYYAGINYDRIYRVAYVGGANSLPIAVATAAPMHGPVPLGVQFDGTASSDPDMDPLTYLWNFGDGGSSTAAAPFHTYTTPGERIATLTVNDGQANDVTTVRIVAGNSAPVVTITQPADGSNYDAGDTISFAGGATDSEDGTLTPADLTWTVLFHHNTHIHPYLGPFSGTVSGDFPIEQRNETAPDVWYELILTATDSGSPLGPSGILTGTGRVEIFPNLGVIQLRSSPASGLALTLDSKPVTAPLDIMGVVGIIRTLGAPVTQAPGDGHVYSFAGWSDSGALQHEIVTLAGTNMYEASFDCDLITEVEVTMEEPTSGGEITLTWDPPADACLATGPGAYVVYASTAVAPSSPPGQFPLDPPFGAVGMTGATSITFTPGAGDEYYLVLGTGSDGGQGPAGHYAP